MSRIFSYIHDKYLFTNCIGLDLWAEDRIASGEMKYILNSKILPCKGPQVRTSCALIPPELVDAPDMVTCGKETSFFFYCQEFPLDFITDCTKMLMFFCAVMCFFP